MNDPLHLEFRHKSWSSMCSVIRFVHCKVNKSFIPLATFNYKAVKMFYPPEEEFCAAACWSCSRYPFCCWIQVWEKHRNKAKMLTFWNRPYDEILNFSVLVDCTFGYLSVCQTKVWTLTLNFKMSKILPF